MVVGIGTCVNSEPVSEAAVPSPRRRRTVACVVVLVPVALGFMFGAVAVAEGLISGGDSRVPMTVMGVTIMLGTGLPAIAAYLNRSLILAVIALIALPVVLVAGRLVGWAAFGA